MTVDDKITYYDFLVVFFLGKDKKAIYGRTFENSKQQSKSPEGHWGATNEV